MNINLSLDQALLLQEALKAQSAKLNAEFERQDADGYVAGSLITKLSDCAEGILKIDSAVNLMRSQLERRNSQPNNWEDLY